MDTDQAIVFCVGSGAEVNKDYVKYLMRHGLRHWQAGETTLEEARALHPTPLEAVAAWVNRAGVGESPNERAANLGAILAAQAHWLCERLLDRQARDFEASGGFSERLHRSRTGRLGVANGQNRRNG